jgi:hypothetical protein
MIDRLSDQDLSGARFGAEPRRRVHRVSNHCVLQPAITAYVPREDLAEADPHAD